MGGIQFQFAGSGQRPTTLITYAGVLKLIMALPGINAREMRTKFADVLQKYFAGDASLVLEMMDNAESTSGVHSLARESLGGAGVYVKDQKRKRIEEDPEERKYRLLRLAAEIERLAAEADQLKANNTEKQLHNIETAHRMYSTMCNGDTIDEPALAKFKENILNV
jgi:hypothetical protein